MDLEKIAVDQLNDNIKKANIIEELHLKDCEKCGGESSSKTVGDESYDYCDDCNWVTH